MRRIAHLSDLHFGRVREEIVEGLLADVAAQRADLVIVSGDLTQRAFRSQFRAARDFLRRLPAPWLAVPGNHDVPTIDVLARYTRPLTRFRRYITDDEYPSWADDEIAAVGINTARSWVWDWSQGRVGWRQMDHIRERFRGLPDHVFRIVFAHHPFLPPPGAPATRLVGRAMPAAAALEAAGVDLLLAGHLHRAYTGDIASHHAHVERSILVAQASTATSTRIREEPQAWNLITVDRPEVGIEVRTWEGAGFVRGLADRWRRGADHRWARVALDTGLGGGARPPAVDARRAGA